MITNNKSQLICEFYQSIEGKKLSFSCYFSRTKLSINPLLLFQTNYLILLNTQRSNDKWLANNSFKKIRYKFADPIRHSTRCFFPPKRRNKWKSSV